jgi:hypothetical protein
VSNNASAGIFSYKFDLFLQTSKPLDVLPDRTVLHGSRGDYIIPNLTNCTYENALDKMEAMLENEQSPSKIPVEYPDEPPEKGSPYYGWMIYPYIKYDLRARFTSIVKKSNISFASFYKEIDYLSNISTVLLPYYPLGFRLYSQHFLVFWSDYEEFLCKLFGCLPCHTSITKVDDALVVYASTQNGEFLSERLFRLCFGMIDTGLVDRFWSSKPVYYWRSNPL